MDWLALNDGTGWNTQWTYVTYCMDFRRLKIQPLKDNVDIVIKTP